MHCIKRKKKNKDKPKRYSEPIESNIKKVQPSASVLQQIIHTTPITFMKNPPSENITSESSFSSTSDSSEIITNDHDNYDTDNDNATSETSYHSEPVQYYRSRTSYTSYTPTNTYTHDSGEEARAEVEHAREMKRVNAEEENNKGRKRQQEEEQEDQMRNTQFMIDTMNLQISLMNLSINS